MEEHHPSTPLAESGIRTDFPTASRSSRLRYRGYCDLIRADMMRPPSPHWAAAPLHPDVWAMLHLHLSVNAGGHSEIFIRTWWQAGLASTTV